MRKIDKRCLGCNAPLSTKRKATKRCRGCFNKFHKGKNHTLYGRSLSDSHKKKISQSKNQPIILKFCYCGKRLNKSNKSGLCQPCSKVGPWHKGLLLCGVEFVERAGRVKYGEVWICRCKCGNLFKAIATNVKAGRVKTCGCSNIEHCKKLGQQQTGPNSPVWIEDRTKTSLYIRGKNYKRNMRGSWPYASRKYKKTKAFTCEITGFTSEKPGDLHVHHIKSVTTHPELVLSFTNFILIRANIHREFHSKYGKVTTSEHWDKFIKGLT